MTQAERMQLAIAIGDMAGALAGLNKAWQRYVACYEALRMLEARAEPAPVVVGESKPRHTHTEGASRVN